MEGQGCRDVRGEVEEEDFCRARIRKVAIADDERWRRRCLLATGDDVERDGAVLARRPSSRRLLLRSRLRCRLFLRQPRFVRGPSLGHLAVRLRLDW